ncbi:MAG: hypothetical protein M0Z36_12400 [Thermaerobacter sp.]|nr:hypothetical protein [Thermaerobacter sp.]
MKITAIRTTAVGFAQTPDTLKRNLVSATSVFDDHYDKSWFGPGVFTLVEIETDDGITGVGTAGGFTVTAKPIIDTLLAPVLIGEDPARIEYLWQRMYRSSIRIGRKGAVMAAISGVDIALWDLKGKALNTPVYNLLGGLVRPRIPCYASRLYALADRDQLAAEARRYRDQGFAMVKQRFGFGPKDGPGGMAANERLIATVRDAIGPDIELAADAYMGWTVEYTMKMAERLTPYAVKWIEEPLMADDWDGYEFLAQRCPIPLSCGEHEYGLEGFRELISRRITRYLQPDANRVGGITVMTKICAVAEAHHLDIIPHSNESHNLHVIASHSNCPIMEYFPNVEPDTGNELFWKVFVGEPVIEHGSVTPPIQPGLGIEINRDMLRALAL